jgi:hypothetical protein
MPDREPADFGGPGFGEHHECPSCGAPCNCHIHDVAPFCTHVCETGDYDFAADDFAYDAAREQGFGGVKGRD